METYRKTLNEVVKKDTSGDYGKLLLAIIGDESVTITEPPQQAPAAEAQGAPTTQEQPVGVRLCTLSTYVGHLQMTPSFVVNVSLHTAHVYMCGHCHS